MVNPALPRQILRILLIIIPILSLLYSIIASKVDLSIFLSTLKSTKIEGPEASVRGLLDISLYKYTRLLYNYKLERYKKNKIYYCKYCIDLPYSGKSIINLRNYLKSKY